MYTYKHIHTCIHTCIHTHISTYLRTYIYKHACTQSFKHAHMHPYLLKLPQTFPSIFSKSFFRLCKLNLVVLNFLPPFYSFFLCHFYYVGIPAVPFCLLFLFSFIFLFFLFCKSNIASPWLCIPTPHAREHICCDKLALLA